MLIVSFAWTVDALLAGLKSVTRRDWPDDYAKRFKPGSGVQAYDKSARVGGKCRAIIRVEDLHREPLSRLVDDPEYGRAELIKEGNLWGSVGEFIAQFKLRHGDPYRFQFALVDIVGKQAALPLLDPVPAVHAEFCKITGQALRLSLCQTFWKELLHTHGFQPEDVALTARYLVRQVNQGKRQDGCLKVFNFANPVQFDADLALARKALPQRRPATAAPQQPVNDEPQANVDPAKLKELRRQLQSRHAGA